MTERASSMPTFHVWTRMPASTDRCHMPFVHLIAARAKLQVPRCSACLLSDDFDIKCEPCPPSEQPWRRSG